MRSESLGVRWGGAVLTSSLLLSGWGRRLSEGGVMGTTRRGFLKALSAVLAAPGAAMAATKPVTPAPAPEFVGAGEWVTKAELEEE